MLCSGVYAGIFTREKVDATLDIDGVRFGDAIEALGWRGTDKAGSTILSAYFELHIEQGPILEAENKTIGIVTGVQGMRSYEATITGRALAEACSVVSRSSIRRKRGIIGGLHLAVRHCDLPSPPYFARASCGLLLVGFLQERLEQRRMPRP